MCVCVCVEETFFWGSVCGSDRVFLFKTTGGKGPSNSHYQNPSSIDPSAGFHSIRAVDERAWVSQTSFWGVGCGFMTCFFTYYITREKIFTSFQVSYVTYIQYVFPIHHYHSSFIHHHQKKKKKKVVTLSFHKPT